MQERHKREGSAWTISAFLSLALLCTIMLNLWNLHFWGKAIDYNRFGNWSDALSGIGTLSAVVVALAGLHRERATQRAAEERQIVETETAAFQWLTTKEVRNSLDHLVGRLWDLKIQNSTVAPIYHWKVTLGSYPAHMCNWQKRPLLPGENVFNLPFLDNLEPDKTPEPTLSFEGRSGRIWTRSARGLIQQVTSLALDCEHGSRDIADNVGE